MKRSESIEFIARGVATRQGNVLVCRNRKHGHCYLPGGHVEFGESAAKALRREFREETGLIVQVEHLLVISENGFVQAGRERHELNLVFHVELDRSLAGLGVPSLEPEIAFEWTPVGNLRDNRFLPTTLIPVLTRILDPKHPFSSGPIVLSDMADSEE